MAGRLDAAIEAAKEGQVHRLILSVFFALLFGVASIVGVAAATEGANDPKRTWEDVLGGRDSSPGVTVRAEETKREAKDGYTQVTYRLVVDGLPEGQLYDAYIYDLGMQLAEGGISGPVSGLDPNKLTFEVGRYMRGEWMEIGFVSADKSTRGFVRITPFPIEASDGKCRVWLEPIFPGESFAVRGSGFVPNENVTWLSRSGKEKLGGTRQVESDGSLPVSILLPANAARKYKANYTVTGQECKVSVDYKWGPPATKWK